MRTSMAVSLGVLVALALGPRLNAQITDDIQATINHPFTVGNQTLPPGKYTFHMRQDTNLTQMIVRNQAGDISAQFTVRESQAMHTPRHSELVFDRAGNSEFLTKLYERGQKIGVAVTELSPNEERLVKQGQRAQEHTEEQNSGD